MGTPGLLQWRVQPHGFHRDAPHKTADAAAADGAHGTDRHCDAPRVATFPLGLASLGPNSRKRKEKIDEHLGTTIVIR
jgi:hypothetical protein